MIQAFYKYKPASFRALALLVYADGKDRLVERYRADALWVLGVCAFRHDFKLPRLGDILKNKSKKPKVSDAPGAFVDKLLRAFGKGGNT